MFGLSNFIITEFLLIFYSLVTNVLYSYTLQDFTSNSDIDWSQSIENIDQQLYKKYNLSQDEIDFIKSKVRAMD